MTTIAFIGLGIMGSPMAVNLTRSGHAVAGFNRSAHRTQALVDAGGRAASSIADAVREAEVIITMLPDSPDVAKVILEPGGVFEFAQPGATVIDMSTIKPAVSRDIAREGEAQGIHVLDAPVSGGESAAVEGSLSIMVGGSAAAFELTRPVLEAMGTTIAHVGPSGAGQTVKSANQLIVAGTIQLVAEALTLLRAQGVDQERAVEVLSGGLAGSAVLDRKAASMLAGNFTPGFRVGLHHKDLGIVAESARAAGVAAPLGSLVSVLMASLVAEGKGDLDHSALLLLTERMSGLAEHSPVGA
ncbi:2-hydroxy-3-oxopropionate reductase [Saccharomonospora sp. NPDC046836]|uniref:2-hydroxy-3-oxopropionate reductase n=1 Tax=Saccharomonospora sp. NPDC046836 TaxID=3156921 RepID=UPI0033C077E7